MKDVTDGQVIAMAKFAIMASKPMGMGFLHYDANLTPHQIDIAVEYETVSVDYFQGRMVKFHARKINGAWEFSPDEPRSDYQSWCTTYPTYRDLYDAAIGG